MTADAASPPPQVAGAEARRLADWVFRVRELGIVAAFALLMLVTAIIEPRFVTADSLRNLALNAAIFAILAAGQTLVIITRNVDLSVGSVLGLAAFMAGDLLSSHQSLPIPVVIVLGMLLGAACGALNGVLVTFGQVPALVVVVVVGQALRDFRSGRELYAIGSNPEGARLAGVRSERRVFSAFLLSGALAGLAGVLFTARFGTVDATAGTGYELTVISATVVGGVAIFGGTGSVYGAALGALLLQTITSSLIVLKVDAFWQEAAIGALLLVAIAFDRLVGLRLDARLRRRSVRRAG